MGYMPPENTKKGGRGPKHGLAKKFDVLDPGSTV